MSTSSSTPFKVGDEACYSVGSDRYPANVISVSKSGHQVVVQDATYTPAPGHNYYGQQKWLFSKNESGATRTFTRRLNGSYRMKGCKSGGLSHGYGAHQDPSF